MRCGKRLGRASGLYVPKGDFRQVIHRLSGAAKPVFAEGLGANSLTLQQFLAVIMGFPKCATPLGRASPARLSGRLERTPYDANPKNPKRRTRLFLGKPAPRTIMKRTYQASKVRRARTHGFLVRMKSRGGRAVINARRAKGRKRLAV